MIHAIAAMVTFLSAIPAVDLDAAAKTPPAPKRITANEKAPGIHLESQGTPATSVAVTATSSTGRAACIAVEGQHVARDRVDMGLKDNVTLIRVERLLEQGGIGSLTIETLLVDPRTRGSKSLGTETIALHLIGSPRSDAAKGGSPSSDAVERVYAYRDAAFVHMIWPTAQPVVQHRDARGLSGGTSCGHAHFVLDAKDVNGPRSSAFATSTLLAEDGDKGTRRTVRMMASLSQSTRDREPLLSVGTAIDARSVSFRRPKRPMK